MVRAARGCLSNIIISDGETWPRQVYETIFRKSGDSMPDDAWILPGHEAAFSEANREGVSVKRLTDLWRENQELHFGEEEAFAAFVFSHLPEMPQQYLELDRVNIGLS